jgi:hypothetical protein
MELSFRESPTLDRPRAPDINKIFLILPQNETVLQEPLPRDNKNFTTEITEPTEIFKISESFCILNILCDLCGLCGKKSDLLFRSRRGHRGSAEKKRE